MKSICNKRVKANYLLLQWLRYCPLHISYAFVNQLCICSKLSCSLVGWLVVLGFDATLTAKVISWRSVTQMCFLAFSHQYQHNFSFQSHRLLFSHTSAEVRGENTPERKVASTGDRSPLSHLFFFCLKRERERERERELLKLHFIKI